MREFTPYAPNAPQRQLNVVMTLCPIVVEAWKNFKDLKTKCSLQQRHNSWGEVFIGEIKLPRHDLIEEYIPWDLDKPFIITLRTLWDISR